MYINDENVKRDPHTIFHSPFKKGFVNRGYVCPTYISSDVFYPGEVGGVQAVTPTKKEILR